MAVKAYVLIVTDPGATKGVYEALSKIEGLVELHEVMGPYDIVAEIDVPQLVDVPPILHENPRHPRHSKHHFAGLVPGAVGQLHIALQDDSRVIASAARQSECPGFEVVNGWRTDKQMRGLQPPYAA